jgi:K+-sensing histidine kinase KdpD
MATIVLKKEVHEPDPLLNQLVTVAVSRQLGHETRNFLNNIDLVFHGLKNERVSPRGEKILRLLGDESTRVKKFVQRYRKNMQYPEIPTEKQKPEQVIKEAALRWQKKNKKTGIHVDCKFLFHAPTVFINSELVCEAVFLILEFISQSITTGKTIEIHGRCETGKIIASMTHKDLAVINPDSIDLFNAYTKDGDLSNLFVARAIIEAHKGAFRVAETLHGKTAFEITLPVSGPENR